MFPLGGIDHPPDEQTLNQRLHVDEHSLTLYETDSPTPDVVAFQVIPGFQAEEVDSSCEFAATHDQESSCTQEESDSNEETNHGSAPISREESPVPTEAHDTIVRWLSVYRTRGTEHFINSLIQSAIESPDTMSRMCRVAQTVVRKVNRMSNLEGKALENAVRFSTLAVFKAYWAPDGTWTEASSTSTNTVSLTLRGFNLAGFMGALFDAGISTAKDIQLCLSMLLEGDKHVDRLCAMHALLVQANDKLCKNRNRPALMLLRDEITSRDSDSGESIWMTSPHSKALVEDILNRIDGWMASQAEKRERLRASGSKRPIPRRAVGPRLRT